MLRRASLALFVLAIGLAVACGRQVTPNPTTAGFPGTLELKFRTVATANFSLYNYFLVVNTSGNGQEPYVSGFQNGQYANFSYAVVTGVSSGATNTVLPILVQYYVIPPTTVRTLQFNLNPATTQLLLDTTTSSAYNEFTLIFARSQLSLPSPTQTSGPTPSPTPTHRGPTPSPTPIPTGAGTPAPTPVSSPTTTAQSTWCINLFTTAGPPTFVPLDALGLGVTDHSFNQGCFDVNQSVDRVYVQPPEFAPPQDPSSQLYGFELINSPST
jgi:hypothetical protein